MNTRHGDTWRRLADAGLVRGEPPQGSLDSARGSPWFVRLMLGFSGWIAALFLLGFIAAALTWVVESEGASIGSGLFLCFVAWLLFRRMGGSDFAAQFALALSFSGQSLFIVGVFGLHGDSRDALAAWLWIAVLQAGLLAVMPNPVHRLWSGFATAGAVYMALQALHAGFLAPPLFLAAAAWAWLQEFRWPRVAFVLRPAAYGLVVALVLVELAAGLFAPGIGLDAEPRDRRLWAQAFNGVVLLAVVWVLLRRAGAAWPGRNASLVLAGVLLIALVSLYAPGIAAGLCILLLGYAHGNAVLTGLGGIALLLYLGGYYYELDTTLLVKSQVMAATGVVLLAVRWLLLRWLAPGGSDA